MQKTGIRTLVASAFLAISLSPTWAADAIQWQTSYSAAMEKAKAGNKLVMADFYTDW